MTGGGGTNTGGRAAGRAAAARGADLAVGGLAAGLAAGALAAGFLVSGLGAGLAVAAAGLMTASGPKQADARMEYLKAFVGKYTKLSEEDQAKKCLICHGANKKQRSSYAMALEKALGAKMVKDMEKINTALTEVEGKEYEDGKTYGQLLNEGHLPAPFAE